MLMRRVKWFLFNAVFFALLWAAVVEQIAGAKNIVLVVIWFFVLLTPLFFNKEIKKKLSEKGRSVPAWLDGSSDVAVVGLLLWNGWMVTGVAYLLHLFFIQAVWADIEENKLKNG